MGERKSGTNQVEQIDGEFSVGGWDVTDCREARRRRGETSHAPRLQPIRSAVVGLLQTDHSARSAVRGSTFSVRRDGT
jgi:hypothetical protein